MGISKVKGSGKLTPEQRNAVAEQYLNGRTMGSLANEYDIGRKSVKGLLICRKIKIRPYIPIPKKRRKVRKSPMPVHEKWATKQVELAVRRGDLKRPIVCSECAAICRTHGHHDDYNRPLSVRWLCPKCHADWHSLHIPVKSDRI